MTPPWLSIALVALLGAPTPQSSAPPEEREVRISIDVREAQVLDVLRLLSELAGFQLVIDPGVSCSLTLKLSEVPWTAVLEHSLRSCDLGQEEEEGVVIAAGAGAMGVRLGQPVTVGGESVWRPELGTGQAPDPDFIGSAVSMIWRGLVIWLTAGLLIVIAGWVS